MLLLAHVFVVADAAVVVDHALSFTFTLLLLITVSPWASAGQAKRGMPLPLKSAKFLFYFFDSVDKLMFIQCCVFFHLELGNSLFGIRSKFPTFYSKLLTGCSSSFFEHT
jgi:hypothetical protein